MDTQHSSPENVDSGHDLLELLTVDAEGSLKCSKHKGKINKD